MTTVAIRATKILPQWELIPISRSFQSYQDPNNFKSWHSCSFQSYLTLGRRHASRQLLELTILASRATKSYQQWELTFLSTVAFRASKILSTVGMDILVGRRVQSYQNSVNFKTWHSCRFQSYLTSGRRYASHQQSELTTVAFRATICACWSQWKLEILQIPHC